MLGAKKILHRSFARLSPVFAAAGAALLLASTAPAKSNAEATTTATAAVRRQSASTQFAHAEEQRAALNSKPTEKRTSSADYKQVVTSYRRVELITPHAPEVPDSLLAVGELYVEMGERFGRSYYQSAVDSYRFLIHEYPTSKFGQDAMSASGGACRKISWVIRGRLQDLR